MDFCNLSVTARLTRDPEVKSFKSGTVAKFGVAYNYGVGEKRKVSYLDCESWDEKKVEFIQKYLKKGSRVTLNGRLDQDNWEKDGVKQSKHVLKVDGIYFADSLKTEENAQAVKSGKKVKDDTETGSDAPF